MGENVNLSQVRGLSKEQRQVLASIIRRDNELWNAVNGVGGLSVESDFGRLQGEVSELKGPLVNIQVRATGKDMVEHFSNTNQNGFYKMDLNQDSYKVDFLRDGVAIAGKDADIKKGETITLDLIVEEDPKTLLLPEGAEEPIIDPVEESTTDPAEEPIV